MQICCCSCCVLLLLLCDTFCSSGCWLHCLSCCITFVVAVNQSYARWLSMTVCTSYAASSWTSCQLCCHCFSEKHRQSCWNLLQFLLLAEQDLEEKACLSSPELHQQSACSTQTSMLSTCRRPSNGPQSCVLRWLEQYTDLGSCKRHWPQDLRTTNRWFSRMRLACFQLPYALASRLASWLFTVYQTPHGLWCIKSVLVDDKSAVTIHFCTCLHTCIDARWTGLIHCLCLYR